MKRFGTISVAMCSLALLLSGCGGDSLDTAKVTGTVTLDGAPATNVRVVFSPDGSGNVAAGNTDSAGKFELSTLKPNDGAKPGTYKVTIVEAPGEVPPMPGTPEHAEWEKNKVDAFPPKYSNADTSGFTATVEAGKDNSFTFDMKK